jgi:hypothetical protein
LKKSFLADERNFSGPLMRFARRHVRDHNAFYKDDHGPSWRRYRALQQKARLKIDFREILSVVRFSTFATVSAQSGPSLEGRAPARSSQKSLVHFG